MKNLIFLAGIVACIATGCILAPDSIALGSRLDNRGNYEGTVITGLWRNPWKPQRVVRVEYVALEGGSSRDDLP